jgi:hypothetical protein
MRSVREARVKDDVTLGEARAFTRKGAHKGTVCPCCQQTVKVYRRALGSSMAVLLCHAARLFGTDRWFSVPKDFAPALPEKHRNLLNGGDYAKLAWWGFVEAGNDRRADGSDRTGMFRVTAKGADFARGLSRVPSHALVYNGQLMRLDTKDSISIQEALRNRFDFNELWRGV